MGFLYLVLPLPSSTLVFVWPFPQEGHTPCKWPVLAGPPRVTSHENKSTGTRVEKSISYRLLEKPLSWFSEQSWGPEPNRWWFYQAAVRPLGPASKLPGLYPSEQKSPTDIINLKMMTRVETVFQIHPTQGYRFHPLNLQHYISISMKINTNKNITMLTMRVEFQCAGGKEHGTPPPWASDSKLFL